MEQIQTEHFKKALFLLFDETFEQVHGIILDKGTSMFETLVEISAAEASIPVGGRCATLAAQVKHVAFYLDVVEEAIRKGEFTRVDWGEIWRTTSEVSPDEWEGLKLNLRKSYDSVRKLIEEIEDWPNEEKIAEAIALVAHSAYHLGEIRQALCTLKAG